MSRLQSRRSETINVDLTLLSVTSLYIAFTCAQRISSRNTAWKNCNKRKIKRVCIHLKFHSKPHSPREVRCTQHVFICLKPTAPRGQPVLRVFFEFDKTEWGGGCCFGFVLFSSLSLHFCIFRLGILKLFGMKPGQNSGLKKYQKEQCPKYSWHENKC